MPLPEIKGEITDLRMDPATNGVIICYTTKTKSPSKGTYENCSYDYKKEVFDADMDNQEDIDKAFERFKQLWMKAYKGK